LFNAKAVAMKLGDDAPVLLAHMGEHVPHGMLAATL
jgi:hypothetical protein